MPALLPGEEQQALLGFMTNAEWDTLLGDVNGLVQRMESLPDSGTKADIFRLLDGIDTIHREALRRLVRLFKEGVLEKVVSDPAIHTLLELYDLLPTEAADEEAPVPAKPAFPTIPIRALRSSVPAPLRFPHWVPVLASVDDLAAGSVRMVEADDRSLLLCRRGDEFFALDARCARDDASLRGATLNGYTLTCANHAGCHYDVRQGLPIGGGAGIECHAIRIDERGRVLVGLDMDFVPNLPSL